MLWSITCLPSDLIVLAAVVVCNTVLSLTWDLIFHSLVCVPFTQNLCAYLHSCASKFTPVSAIDWLNSVENAERYLGFPFHTAGLRVDQSSDTILWCFLPHLMVFIKKVFCCCSFKKPVAETWCIHVLVSGSEIRAMWELTALLQNCIIETVVRKSNPDVWK